MKLAGRLVLAWFCLVVAVASWEAQARPAQDVYVVCVEEVNDALAVLRSSGAVCLSGMLCDIVAIRCRFSKMQNILQQ